MLSEKLSQYDGTQKILNDIVSFVSPLKKVIIFGAGVGGKQLYEWLEKKNLSERVVAFSDNNEMKFYSKYMRDDCYVIPPNMLVEKFSKEISIIIASSAYPQILSQLQKLGFQKKKIRLFNLAFSDFEYTDCKFIWDNIAEFERAYRKMRDKKSKEIFCDILNYKITKDERYLEHMSFQVDDEVNQYFDETVYRLGKEESFLDIGAFTGDTLTRFAQLTGGKWSNYYAFEADEKVYEELTKKVRDIYSEMPVQLYNYAAWDKETELHFEENPGSSMMRTEEKANDLVVKADRVDKFFKDEKVTIIKMDIEGAEYNAILGMQELIKREKPIIAMSVYHRRDDFYKLTDLVERLVPKEYSFYMRQYRYTPTETVCYAVPSHRAAVSDEN